MMPHESPELLNTTSQQLIASDLGRPMQDCLSSDSPRTNSGVKNGFNILGEKTLEGKVWSTVIQDPNSVCHFEDRMFIRPE